MRKDYIKYWNSLKMALEYIAAAVWSSTRFKELQSFKFLCMIGIINKFDLEGVVSRRDRPCLLIMTRNRRAPSEYLLQALELRLYLNNRILLSMVMTS